MSAPSPPPIRVLFDAAAVAHASFRVRVFSRGPAEPGVWTGIGRVALEVAVQLERREDVDLRLGVSEAFRFWAWTADALRAYPALARRLVKPAHGRVEAEVARRAAANLVVRLQSRLADRQELAERVREGDLIGALRALRPARRAAAQLALRANGALGNLEPSIQPAMLDDVDLYHSPAHAFPRAVLERNVPRVLTVHDVAALVHPEWSSPMQRRFVERVVAAAADATAVVADSESTRRDLLNLLGAKRVPSYVVLLGVDRDVWRPADASTAARVARAYGLDDRPFFLAVARQEKRKNLEGILRGFARARDQGVDARLALVGTAGPSSRVTHAAIRELDLASDVVLTGFVPDGDLRALYTSARALLYVSHYEGFGLPMLEAMACGAPVVAGDNSSMPEVGGDAALYADAGSAEAIAAAVVELERDDGLRSELGERGLGRARELSWSRTAADLTDVYRDVLSRRGEG